MSINAVNREFATFGTAAPVNLPETDVFQEQVVTIPIGQSGATSPIGDKIAVTNDIDEIVVTDKVGEADETKATTQTDAERKAVAEELKTALKDTRGEQGVIGKLWDGFKNLTTIGAGSNKAEAAIEKYEKGEITEEEARKAVEDYQKGQEQVVDVVADVATSVIAVALVPFTGGMSLLAGAGIGAVVKPAIKGLDALSGGREYGWEDIKKDAVSGAFNGALSVFSAGVAKHLASGVQKLLPKFIGKEATNFVVKHLKTLVKAVFKIVAQADTGAGKIVIGGVSGLAYNSFMQKIGNPEVSKEEETAIKAEIQKEIEAQEAETSNNIVEFGKLTAREAA